MSLGGTYPFRIGGPSVVAYNLVRQLDKKGFKVEFVYGVSKEQHARGPHQPYFSFSENVNLVPVVKNERSPTSYASSFDANFLSDTVRLARDALRGADVIHFCNIPSSFASVGMAQEDSLSIQPSWVDYS